MFSGNLLPIAIVLNLYASEVWKPVTKIPGTALVGCLQIADQVTTSFQPFYCRYLPHFTLLKHFQLGFWASGKHFVLY